MNASTFDGFTVLALKAIARDRNLTGYSRMRRAELIELLLADDRAMKAEILAETAPEVERPRFRVSLMDYPAADGRVVTEAHVKICADRGCATYVIDGKDQGMCPRCGEFAEWYLAQVAEQEKALAAIEPFESSIPVLAESERKSLIIPATPVIEAFPDSVRSDTYAIDYRKRMDGVIANVKFDAEAEARKAMDAVKNMAYLAQRTLDTIPNTDARFDAAYQIWLDLSRAADELERTHYGIREGLF